MNLKHGGLGKAAGSALEIAEFNDGNRRLQISGRVAIGTDKPLELSLGRGYRRGRKCPRSHHEVESRHAQNQRRHEDRKLLPNVPERSGGFRLQSRPEHPPE